jgi:DNA end-binding protein Ku
MPRPYWSGQVQISLVSFGVKLFTATESTSQISLHDISRRTGERVHHQNVTESQGPIERADIVKGYEYSKGEYVVLEPKEIERLRIPGKRTLEVEQFVDVKEIDIGYFEKPYFVVPENEAQASTFGVIRRALQETGKAALGEIAFAGREHLVALMPAPGKDSLGMMAYTMRYEEELREAEPYFSEIKNTKIDSDQLALAKELIHRNSAKFEPSKFKDDYEAALQAAIAAKVNHKPLPKEAVPHRGNVINLMDALRRSLDDKTATPGKTTAAGRTAPATATARSKAKGPVLVHSAPRRRKSA